MSESPNDAFPAAIRAEIEKRIGAFEYSQIGCGNFAEEVWKLCRRPDPAPVGVDPVAVADIGEMGSPNGWRWTGCVFDLPKGKHYLFPGSPPDGVTEWLIEELERTLLSADAMWQDAPRDDVSPQMEAGRSMAYMAMASMLRETIGRAKRRLVINSQPGAVVGEQAWHDITKLRQYLEEAGHPEGGDALMTADSLLRTVTNTDKGVGK